MSPAPRQPWLRVGGPARESCVSLALHGTDLDPRELTARLGCSPTESVRRGERPRAESPPAAQGAWILEFWGVAPQGPEDLIERALAAVSADARVWAELRARCSAQLRVALFSERANTAFALQPRTLARLAELQLELIVDCYHEGPAGV